MVELKHLRYLIAVNEETTFVRAAERIHLAQPALSRQIHKFEKAIGTPVFERGRTGVTLTPAGEICLQTARSVIQRVERAAETARMADAGRGGTCRIFVSKWAIWSGFSARLVGYLAITEPAIRVAIKEGDIAGHWAGLQHNEVDVTIGTKPWGRLKELHCEMLLDDVVDMAILSQNHPLAGRPSLKLSDLAGEMLLMYDETVLNYDDHDLFAAFRKVGFDPDEMRILPSSEALLAMVAAGRGWSLHRRSLRNRIPGVAMVPIEDFDLPFPVALLRRADETRPIVVTVMRRIHQLAARDYPDMYHTGDATETSAATVRHASALEHQLDLRDLRYFTAAIEEESIGGAAERLGLSQPTLSRQIRHLERDLGVTLLDRAPRGIVPTPAGESFYRDAQEILDEVARLPAEVERGRRAAGGVCIVAATPSANVREILNTVLRKAETTSLNLEILVQEVPTPMQPAAVHSAKVDIGLCHPFTNLAAGYPDIDCRVLIEDVLDGALLPIGHPLAKRSSITFADLADIPFVFFRREFHPAFHDLVTETFRSHGYRPMIGPMQEGISTMWALAAEGEGWCLASGSERKDPPTGLVGVPIEGFSIPWGISLLTRRDESRTTALTVINLLLDAARLEHL
jgi:DNA-binding transcriptional LysR family regulator